jgi:outer membrane protein OmpA-like peptidoglycan-associated protein
MYSFSFSQKFNKTIYSGNYKVNDSIEMRFVTNCLGRTCPDGIALDTYDSLALVASFIKKHPEFIFQIESHTDNRGSIKSNIKLSQNRADFLRKIIIKEGVDSLVIIAKGFGGTCPIIQQKQIDLLKIREEKEKLYSQNRRTVLRIIREK